LFRVLTGFFCFHSHTDCVVYISIPIT
jgi:hypothetical protein